MPVQERNAASSANNLQCVARTMAGVPFKLFLPYKNLKVGVVARSLVHLHSIIKEKFGLSCAEVTLEDGTLLCNEEYFSLLEPQTNLVVQLREGISGGKFPISEPLAVLIECSSKWHASPCISARFILAADCAMARWAIVQDLVCVFVPLMFMILMKVSWTSWMNMLLDRLLCINF